MALILASQPSRSKLVAASAGSPLPQLYPASPQAALRCAHNPEDCLVEDSQYKQTAPTRWKKLANAEYGGSHSTERPTRVQSSSRALLPEVLEFDAFAAEYGSAGGWHPDDHAQFLRLLQPDGGICRSKAAALLFHLSAQETDEHIRSTAWQPTVQTS